MNATRYEVRTISITEKLAGYATSNVSGVSPITPTVVALPIIECNEAGEPVDIIDGFHRIAGFAAAGLSEFRAVCCTTDGSDDLVAAAASPDGYGDWTQKDAIAEIYRLAGVE